MMTRAALGPFQSWLRSAELVVHLVGQEFRIRYRRAYLGWLWLASDNLLVPIVTHAAYDFAALVYLLRRGVLAASDDPFVPHDGAG